VCVCVCVYIYMYMYMRECVRMNLCRHVSTYLCVYVVYSPINISQLTLERKVLT